MSLDASEEVKKVASFQKNLQVLFAPVRNKYFIDYYAALKKTLKDAYSLQTCENSVLPLIFKDIPLSSGTITFHVRPRPSPEFMQQVCNSLLVKCKEREDAIIAGNLVILTYGTTSNSSN